MSKPDKFARLAYRCAKCGHSGTVKVWVRPGEVAAQSALRHSAETKAACVSGCRYVAAETPEPGK